MELDGILGENIMAGVKLKVIPLDPRDLIK